jgi:actin-related protein 9
LSVGGTGEAGPSTSNSRATSAAPQPPSLKVTDYLVGPQLDEALAAGQEITVSWPFVDGQINDFMQAEALWYVCVFHKFPPFLLSFRARARKILFLRHENLAMSKNPTIHRKYVLFTGLQLRRVQNESPVLLSLFSGLSRDAYERAGQIFFERFNVAAFSIIDRPMAQLYAAGALSGIVVDIGDTLTDVTPIYDGFPLSGLRMTARVGTRHCERFLAHLLRNNTSVTALLTELAIPPAEYPATLRALARQVWQAGLVRVPVDGIAVREAEDEGVTDIAAVLVAGKEKAVIESGLKRRATAKASAAEQARAKEIEALDLVTVEFRGKEVTLGKERHRFCEPLFDKNLLNLGDGPPLDEHASPEGEGIPMTLQDAVGHTVRLTDVEQRQYIWLGLMVTGDVATYVKGKSLSALYLLLLSRRMEVSLRRYKIIFPHSF